MGLLSVKNMERMQMFQGQQNVRSIEPGSIFLESTDLGEIKEKLSSWTVLKHKE
jgi:hypothetical protein